MARRTSSGSSCRLVRVNRLFPRHGQQNLALLDRRRGVALDHLGDAEVELCRARREALLERAPASSRGTAYCSATTRWAPAALRSQGVSPPRVRRAVAVRAKRRRARHRARRAQASPRMRGRAYRPGVQPSEEKPSGAPARGASGWPIRLDAITPVERRAAIRPRRATDMRGHRGTVAREARIRKSRFDPVPKGQFWRRQTGGENRSKRPAFFAQLFSSSMQPVDGPGKGRGVRRRSADPDRRAGLP